MVRPGSVMKLFHKSFLEFALIKRIIKNKNRVGLVECDR